ncbi:MAG: glycosyltransferase family 2 protein [Candidatus Hydrogenedentes bacterium]|jgi:glycosyltransferase involved in cell wall biosynthesis|nr:glycosyltransferase family 2 protein [Candidatus Hydrogenedentota bacterium]
MYETNAHGSDDHLRNCVVVVIPCFNAGPRLRPVLEESFQYVNRVIVVDDGSTDGGTEDIENEAVTLIRFPHNKGKGHALNAGIRRAIAMPGLKCIALLDADGQHNPHELPHLFAVFQETVADLLVGSRHLDKSKTPWRSRFGNRLTAWIMNRFFACPLSDTQCGYRLLSPGFAQDFVHAVPCGRYETELLMILYAIRRGYQLQAASVSTLYEPGNRSSHFRKFRDSSRIYSALLRSRFTSKLFHPGPADNEHDQPAGKENDRPS